MIDISKLDEVRKSFATIIRYKNEMEDKVWRLIKHPAVTGSQIMEAKDLLLGVDEPLRKVVTALRERYPYPTISMATRPWHKPEYDRYDQAIGDA